VLREQLLSDLDFMAPPKAQVFLIWERGWKAHIVMRSPGSFVALLYVCHYRVLAAMRINPALAQVLQGEHDGAVKSVSVSAVLSTAVVVC